MSPKLYICRVRLKIKFYLKHPKRERCAVEMSLSLKGRMMIPLPETVEVKYWDAAAQRMKNAATLPDNERVNNRLDQYRLIATKAYNRLKDDLPGVTIKELFPVVYEAITGIKTAVGFWPYFEQFVQIKKKMTKTIPGRTSIINAYNQTERLLKEFRPGIDFNSFTQQFEADFVAYMAEKKKYSVNNIGKHIKVLKTVLNSATIDGVNTSLIYKRYKVLQADVDVIYLSEAEIDKIAEAPLKNGIETQRDLFIIGCYTGLRYSDFGFLTKDNFQNGYIVRRQQKTGDEVIIPIHPKLQAVLNKYPDGLPRVFENQKINEYLKRIGKEAGITEPVTYREQRYNEVITHTVPKYELITTHTGRRSFATNLFLELFPPLFIMKITGHKTEKSFLKYIRVKPLEGADMLRKHWAERMKAQSC